MAAVLQRKDLAEEALHQEDLAEEVLHQEDLAEEAFHQGGQVPVASLQGDPEGEALRQGVQAVTFLRLEALAEEALHLEALAEEALRQGGQVAAASLQGDPEVGALQLRWELLAEGRLLEEQVCHPHLSFWCCHALSFLYRLALCQAISSFCLSYVPCSWLTSSALLTDPFHAWPGPPQL